MAQTGTYSSPRMSQSLTTRRHGGLHRGECGFFPRGPVTGWSNGEKVKVNLEVCCQTRLWTDTDLDANDLPVALELPLDVACWLLTTD